MADPEAPAAEPVPAAPIAEAELEAPVILDRTRHRISRRDIDPDCLKVLYRLNGHGYVAYLVGGAVRDLMLGRKPADFDVGTNAHPNQIKKLFRNAFLIGRRFRLAHVRFQGGKVIEVSTFRRKPDEDEIAAEREEEAARAAAERDDPDGPGPGPGEAEDPGSPQAGPEEAADAAAAGPRPECAVPAPGLKGRGGGR